MLQVLLIPEKTDAETAAVAEAWKRRGGEVRHLGKYWIKDDDLTKIPLAVYGNQTFSLILAQIYNFSLISPDDACIAELDQPWTGRTIELRTIEEINSAVFPVFIKPVVPKTFQAGVFQNYNAFEKVIRGLAQDEKILLSNIVAIEAEARSFVFEGQIMDLAVYEGEADIEEGKKFLTAFLQAHTSSLPKSLVIDLAFGSKTGWFVLEFNAAWGAGLNGCDADKVIDGIAGATIS